MQNSRKCLVNGGGDDGDTEMETKFLKITSSSRRTAGTKSGNGNERATLLSSASRDNKSNQSNRNLLSSFLRIYFDFSYAFLCSPFRFVQNEISTASIGPAATTTTTTTKTSINDDQYFRLKSSPFQKLICAVVNILGIFIMCTDTRKILPSSSAVSGMSKSPIGYFQLIDKLLAISFQLKTFSCLWFHQESFLNLVNYLEKNRLEFDSSSRIFFTRYLSISTMARGLCTLYGVMALTQVVGIKLLAPYDTWHVSGIWNANELVSYARYMFFLDNSKHDDMSAEVEYFLAVLAAIGFLGRFISGLYTDLCLLFGVITVWMASYSFANLLEDDKQGQKEQSGIHFEHFAPAKISAAAAFVVVVPFQHQQQIVQLEDTSRRRRRKMRKKCWIEIHERFQISRKLFQLANQTFGTMLTMYLGASLLYNSIKLDGMFVIKGALQLLPAIFFFFVHIAFWMFAADSFKQLDKLRFWLGEEENRREINKQTDIFWVINELETQSVGLRASGIFTVTYSALWNICTTSIIYFIICLQSKHDQDDGGGLF